MHARGATPCVRLSGAACPTKLSPVLLPAGLRRSRPAFGFAAAAPRTMCPAACGAAARSGHAPAGTRACPGLAPAPPARRRGPAGLSSRLQGGRAAPGQEGKIVETGRREAGRKGLGEQPDGHKGLARGTPRSGRSSSGARLVGSWARQAWQAVQGGCQGLTRDHRQQRRCSIVEVTLLRLHAAAAAPGAILLQPAPEHAAHSLRNAQLRSTQADGTHGGSMPATGQPGAQQGGKARGAQQHTHRRQGGAPLKKRKGTPVGVARAWVEDTG